MSAVLLRARQTRTCYPLRICTVYSTKRALPTQSPAKLSSRPRSNSLQEHIPASPADGSMTSSVQEGTRVCPPMMNVLQADLWVTEKQAPYVLPFGFMERVDNSRTGIFSYTVTSGELGEKRKRDLD
ncbi:unnamed protein product [Pleuronectes platessa]|uniref:Uncharacterized protein n=1 Tax=Pleuronectes platessa TaxID=8262 RepID=A0A9N7VFP0_PLEPL|nr:unnamed protein product [Pleuronectes platessa]